MVNDVIKVRIAKLSDLKNIQELNSMLFIKEIKEFDSTLNPDWTFSVNGTKYFSEAINSSNSCVLVSVFKNKIIGYLLGSIQDIESYRKISKIAEIENMLVLDEFRGKNIGSKLINEFMKWCNNKKVTRLKVVASAMNNKAINFYKKHGFKDYSLTLEKDLI